MARKTGHLCRPDEKFCTACKQCRPLDGFAKRGTRDGWGTRCGECREDPEYVAKLRASKRRHALWSKFRWRQEDYDAKLAEQGGGCAICGKTDPGATSGKCEYLPVDHSHKTGKTRGILCPGCNLAIGHMEEDPERLEAAARYLRSYMS